MTVPGTDNGVFLGGLNGGYWNAFAQAQSNTINAANLTNLGAVGTLLAQQAARSRPPIEDAGIRAGEIIAYRAWMWSRGLLRSMAANFAWIPGEIVGGDPIKAGLGVHAFKTLGDAVGQYGGFANDTNAVVFGTVALWGDVIEHEKGYRAEFGAVRSIVMVWPSDEESPKWKFWKKPRRVLRDVRRTYGVEIE